MSEKAALVLLGLMFLHPNDDLKKQELEKLQGSWTMIGCEEKGDPPLSKEDIEKDPQSIVIDGPNFTIIRGKRKVKAECTFRIDPSQKPASLDIVFPDGKAVNYAIYSLQEDELRICVSRKYRNNTPEERPIKFTTKREDNKNLPGLVLETYRREKKAK